MATAFEAEVLPGLESFARAEIVSAGATVERVDSGTIAFTADRWEPLYALRRTVAVYRRITFDVPRPKSLLGDEHFRRLVTEVEEIRRRSKDPFDGFRIGAAGSDSPVFLRLIGALEQATGLRHRPESGELLVRVKPAPDEAAWDVLPRLTPRPLSTREWRVCNMPGGLNATLAAAMHDFAVLGADLGKVHARYLNAMCGSGTLLVEWRLAGATGYTVGCDLAVEAVTCAHENIAAAGLARDVEVLHADAVHFVAPDGSFDLITADVPWGDAIGTHQANATLYPAFLDEAARLLAPEGVLVVLTHEVQLFECLLKDRWDWRVDRVVTVFHGGHWPRMYRLVRREEDAPSSDMLAP